MKCGARFDFGNGGWKGRRCFVVGGGPSLAAIDFSKFNLAGVAMIGANMAFLKNVDVNVVLDLRVVRKLFADSRWKAWQECGGRQYWVVNEEPKAAEFFPGFRKLCRTQSWTERLGSCYCKDNSGLSALHLAYLSGADPIILLGFDCNPPAEANKLTAKTENWHDEYPADWRSNADHVYANTRKAFEDVAKEIGIRRKIINANPASAIECWPKMPFEQAWEATR